MRHEEGFGRVEVEEPERGRFNLGELRARRAWPQDGDGGDDDLKRGRD
jgi:hypothetical protein